MKLALFRLGLLLAALTLVNVTCAAQKQSTGERDEPLPPPPKSINQGQESGWKRYELNGGKRDEISVFLPARPEDFPGGKFKAPPDIELPAHLYLLSRDATNFFAAFIDLPKASEEMSASQRGDIFYGCWRGIAGKMQGILQRNFGGSFEISGSSQKVRVMNEREQRMQDFSIGSQQGRAQIVFAGQRAYLLVAVWHPTDSKSVAAASQFLDSFQVRRTLK